MTWPVEHRAEYAAAMWAGTQTRTRVDVFDRSQRFLRSAGDLLLDGSVQLTNADSIARTCVLTLDDPDHALELDSDSPVDGFSSLKYLVGVTKLVLLPTLGIWAPVPMGMFQPSQPQRDGITVTLTGEDKSARYLRHRSAYSISPNVNIVEAIRNGILGTGENLLDFPTPGHVKARTVRHHPVGGPNDDRREWIVWSKMAKSIDHQLGVWPDGRFFLRPIPTRGNVVMRWDVDSITAPSSKNSDLRTLANRVIAKGKGHAHSNEHLRAADELSRVNLAIHGVPYDVISYQDQPDLHQSALDRWTKFELGRMATQQVSFRFEAGVPAYHGQPLDYVALTWRGIDYPFPLQESTIPLGGGTQSVGYTKAYRHRPAA